MPETSRTHQSEGMLLFERSLWTYDLYVELFFKLLIVHYIEEKRWLNELNILKNNWRKSA